MIEITNNISISEERINFKASRSSGPGGQNVNKVNTRITLFFDVSNCENISDEQKQLILKRFATRADKNGVIRVVSQKYRTQKANRRAAVERLCEFLKEALESKPKRKKTKVPYSTKQKRLEQKRQRSLLKQQRAKKNWVKDLED